MPSAPVTVAQVNGDPSTYESKYVHEVYEQIASHFSATRYKPWPIVSRFLAGLPAGWVGLDSGTGNGKYLPLPAERSSIIWTIGLDRSRNLLEAARVAGGTCREVVWGDILDGGWRHGAFDYAISIATIHHLATWERRRLAVEKLLERISPTHGRILIYVWAIEQDTLSKRSIPTSGSDVTPETSDGQGQDVFVPWTLGVSSQPHAETPSCASRAASERSGSTAQALQTFERYYHMFAQGELQRLVEEAASSVGLQLGNRANYPTRTLGLEIVHSGWERSNYYIEIWRWQA